MKIDSRKTQYDSLLFSFSFWESFFTIKISLVKITVLVVLVLGTTGSDEFDPLVSEFDLRKFFRSKFFDFEETV